MFKLYTSKVTGVKSNCKYDTCIEVKDDVALSLAVAHDYTAAKYKNNYRSSDNFLSSDCLVFDVDNDHSDSPLEWKTVKDVRDTFKDVSFAVHFSRSHMKEKSGKAARPKFHVFFPINEVNDKEEYVKLKKECFEVFPYFDENALDAARFFFGTEDPLVEFHKGLTNLNDFLDERRFASLSKAKSIKEGSRNSHMSRFAAKILKRLGATSEALEKFEEENTKCNPPLEKSELKIIWGSALKFYNTIKNQKDYVEPEEYKKGDSYKPTDFSDVAQARVLAGEYQDILAYSPFTDFMVYNGSYWEESKEKAQYLAQELTDKQLEEASREIARLAELMKNNGSISLIEELGAKKAMSALTDEQNKIVEDYEKALAYYRYVIKRRDSKYISNVLREAHPLVLVTVHDFDNNEFLINTPSFTFDLRTGSKKVHEFSDYMTKQTLVDPGTTGSNIWLDALNTIFESDEEIIEYVQKVVGLASIGKVYNEALIIAYGDGSNGKSTFWNVIARCLGSYSCGISADILTIGCKRNAKPELAEAKGKRLLIAAELEEGVRLNTSNVKQLCSTDKINAEKKYKDPFSYTPSHTLVLYTNHLPRVGAIDNGTWRRLIVIPFNAKIKGKKDIKNYADYLFEAAGEAIMAWIIEGAKKVIKDKYILAIPSKVKEAMSQYKDNNDWIGAYLDECCEREKTYKQKSGELYQDYRAYCLRSGEWARSNADFTRALEAEGFEKHKTKSGIIICGIRFKSEFIN